MKKSLGILLAALLAGCTTVEYSNEGGRRIVAISNSGWYLFNLIPIASGDPDKVNKVSCRLLSETATLDNNIKILNNTVKNSGAKAVRSVKSFWTDESVFVILMKRHVIHTSAELVFDGESDRKQNL